MRRLTTVLLAAACILGTAGAALAAAGPTLAPGGQTLAGPGTVAIAVGVTATVASNIPSVDACATVINTGTIAIDFTMIGSGTGTVQVGPRATASMCRGSLQTVNLTCLGNGTISCGAQWRVDQIR